MRLDELIEAGKGRDRSTKVTPSLSRGENKRNKKAAASKERQQGRKAAHTVDTSLPSAWPGLIAGRLGRRGPIDIDKAFSLPPGYARSEAEPYHSGNELDLDTGYADDLEMHPVDGPFDDLDIPDEIPGKDAHTVDTSLPSAWPGLMDEEGDDIVGDWNRHHDRLAYGPDDEEEIGDGYNELDYSDNVDPTDPRDAFVSGNFIDLDPASIGGEVDMTEPQDPDDPRFDSVANRKHRMDKDTYGSGRMAKRESVHEAADPDVVKALKALFE